jgi:hypothetical protein
MQSNRILNLIDVILFLSGVCLVLLSDAVQLTMLTSLLQALGTGLVAASIVSGLSRFADTRDETEKLRLWTSQRIIREDLYNRLREKAKTHDLMAIALTGSLQHFIDSEKLLNGVVLHRTEHRLMFLRPGAEYVKQRAREDCVELEQLKLRLCESAERSRRIYEKLRGLWLKYGENRTGAGSLEIRVMQMCPHMTIFRADKTIIWGLYLSYIPGASSAAVEVEREKGDLALQLEKHFETLWKEHEEYWIVRFDKHNGPRLNEELLEVLKDESGP